MSSNAQNQDLKEMYVQRVVILKLGVSKGKVSLGRILTVAALN